MYQMKLFFKSKIFLSSFLIIVLLTIINVYNFYELSSNSAFVTDITSFSFWNYVRVYGMGQIIMFTSPIVIMLVAISSINEKINSSFFKSELLRVNYKKRAFIELIKAYLKGMLIFITISVFVFIIGTFIFSNNLIVLEYADYITTFYDEAIQNPFIYVFLYHLLIALFCMFVVNLGLISMYFIKKLPLTVISAFILLNALNFLVGNVMIAIGNIVGNEKFLNYTYNINIFEGYMVHGTLFQAFIDIGIYFILSLCVVVYLYRSKEKVVLNFD